MDLVKEFFIKNPNRDIKDPEVVDWIVAEWKKGESRFTEAAIAEMRESRPVLYKAMLADRNAAWMPRIEEYLAAGQNVFIIAGLAHMHGPDGLLRMLELSGCTVEQFR